MIFICRLVKSLSTVYSEDSSNEKQVYICFVDDTTTTKHWYEIAKSWWLWNSQLSHAENWSRFHMPICACPSHPCKTSSSTAQSPCKTAAHSIRQMQSATVIVIIITESVKKLMIISFHNYKSSSNYRIFPKYKLKYLGQYFTLKAKGQHICRSENLPSSVASW